MSAASIAWFVVGHCCMVYQFPIRSLQSPIRLSWPMSLETGLFACSLCGKKSGKVVVGSRVRERWAERFVYCEPICVSYAALVNRTFGKTDEIRYGRSIWHCGSPSSIYTSRDVKLFSQWVKVFIDGACALQQDSFYRAGFDSFSVELLPSWR